MRQEHQPLVLFVSVPEAARRLGIGKTLLYAQISMGKFPHRKIGGRIVVSVKVLEKLAEPDAQNATLVNQAS
jgi:predicted DNA-binding transcriptional regulator AlpA